jgi:hypothetical protein
VGRAYGDLWVGSNEQMAAMVKVEGQKIFFDLATGDIA